jgi:hypothetical protein
MTQIYQIRVRGHLSDAWVEWFDGLSIENLPNGEALLSGPVVDKAALHGLLTKVRDLNLTLVAVTLIEPEQ